MHCTKCGTLNEDTYQFCLSCGAPLSAPKPKFIPEDRPPLPSVPQTSMSVEVTPTPQQPVKQHQSPAPLPAQPPVKSGSQAYQQPAPSTYLGTSGSSFLNIWGPFAGYGHRRQHIGWLMDNKGDHAQDLVNKVDSKFKERKIPATSVQQQTLVARGVIVENRPYFILRRGLVSMGLYITKFGRDLFVSIVSYLKPPISNFRVIILVIMVLFWLYSVFIFPNSIADSVSSLINRLGGGIFGGPAADAGGLFGLLCLVGPLAFVNSIALFLFFIYSIYKWITERDFLAGLRVSPNEFNEDDLMALEKAIEQTVRVSLDEIGLDPDDLKPITDLDSNRLI